MAQLPPDSSGSEQAQDQDIAASEQLFTSYHDILFRRIMALTRDKEATEDLVQETFIRAFRSLKNRTQPRNFEPWLYGIATNVARDYLQRREHEKNHFQVEKAISTYFDEKTPNIANNSDEANLLHIHILEEPLTAQNLTTIISALTELTTKYWLIAKGRFSDLIEYTQTHNGRFAEEAHTVITRVSYNSPFNMDWKVDLSAPPVAEALVTTIDGITQRRARLEKAELENKAKALEIKEAGQKAEQENQMALLEQEKQRLELEQRRLEVLEKQLEVQKKGIEYALEIASKVVDTLHPGADPATRAMEIQTLLPNLIQLQNGKGLELAVPPPPKSDQQNL